LKKILFANIKDNIMAIKSEMYKFFIMLPLLVISEDIINPKYNDFDEQITLMENKITELENLERLTETRLYEIHKEKDEQQSLLNGLINKKLDTLEIEKQKIIKRFKMNENIVYRHEI
jgi:hypothetical protein